MTLKEAITKDNFKNKWRIDNETDLSALGDDFYEYYKDDELRINGSRFDNYWNIFITPIISTISYEIKRWKNINDFDLKSKSETNNTTNINLTNTNTSNLTDTSNGTTTNNSNVNIENGQGYAGYTIANQTGQFRKDVSRTTSNDTSTIENTSNSTNKSDATSKEDISQLTSFSSINASDVRLWLENNYELITNKFYGKIRNILFIEVW